MDARRKSTRNVLVAFAATVMMFFAAAVPAQADQHAEWREGGLWEWGVHEWSSTVLSYSYYSHNERWHYAKACNKARCVDATRAPWSTARASLPASFGGNTAHYDVY